MGYEFRRYFQVETKTLLWLIGILVVSVILFQSVEIPHHSFGLSIFSRGETPVQSNTTRSTFNSSVGENATLESSVVSNVTLPSPSSNAFEWEDGGLRNDSESHGSIGSSSGFDNRTSPVGLQEGDRNVTLDAVPISSNGSTANTEVLFSSQNDSLSSNLTLTHNHTEGSSLAPERNESLRSDLAPPLDKNGSLETGSSPPSMASKFDPPPAVYTISDMYELLMENRQSSSHSMIPRWSSKIDRDLLYARSEIESATKNDRELYAPIYRNVTRFLRSYELMEEMLKVYIYKEGAKPIFHKGPLDGIYASEGWFMKLLEANRHFVTRDGRKAHLFYLPFSSRNLEEALYVPDSHSHKNLVQHLKEYLDSVAARYPFWNRTDGADHFLVACHDWAPSETRSIMVNCIRALCNADVKEGFVFGKDVSLPETNIPKARDPVRGVGGKPPSQRKTLAFYAGRMHGYVRPILLQYWGDKDPDMKIFGQLRSSKGNKIYLRYMKSSKYCICPRGYEVNSPRVVEAIFFECVPVIISDNFVPPFFEILNWESFAVFVLEKDIPNLKNILLSIPEKTYLRMQMRVKKVQQHFLWHPNPVKYDLFHMILHSIWYNRVFQSSSRS